MLWRTSTAGRFVTTTTQGSDSLGIVARLAMFRLCGTLPHILLHGPLSKQMSLRVAITPCATTLLEATRVLATMVTVVTESLAQISTSAPKVSTNVMTTPSVPIPMEATLVLATMVGVVTASLVKMSMNATQATHVMRTQSAPIPMEATRVLVTMVTAETASLV